LTGGGHNAGIVSEPGHPGHSYRIYEHKNDAAYLSASAWLDLAEKREGSWWQGWHDWLMQHDTKKRIAPPAIDASLPAAPGTYVMQK
jgi:polyhydroxyalkanoate synthase subunit PhaC